MADVSTLQDQISAYVRDEILLEPDLVIAPDANLFTEGLLDSVGIMRLIAHLEETYAFTVPPTDLTPEHFRSIAVMAAYVQARGGAASAA